MPATCVWCKRSCDIHIRTIGLGWLRRGMRPVPEPCVSNPNTPEGGHTRSLITRAGDYSCTESAAGHTFGRRQDGFPDRPPFSLRPGFRVFAPTPDPPARSGGSGRVHGLPC